MPPMPGLKAIEIVFPSPLVQMPDKRTDEINAGKISTKTSFAVGRQKKCRQTGRKGRDWKVRSRILLQPNQHAALYHQKMVMSQRMH